MCVYGPQLNPEQMVRAGSICTGPGRKNVKIQYVENLLSWYLILYHNNDLNTVIWLLIWFMDARCVECLVFTSPCILNTRQISHGALHDLLSQVLSVQEWCSREYKHIVRVSSSCCSTSSPGPAILSTQPHSRRIKQTRYEYECKVQAMCFVLCVLPSGRTPHHFHSAKSTKSNSPQVCKNKDKFKIKKTVAG